MNSVKALWRRRIVYLVKLYYKFISFQLDLVSISYLIGMMIFLGYYYFPEVGGYIEWIQKEPFRSMIYLFSILIVSRGKHSGYLKEADELFLTPLGLYGKEFLRYSHWLNRLMSMMFWVVWVYALSMMGILSLNPLGFFVTGLLWKWLKMNGRFFIQQIGGKWVRRIVLFIYSSFMLSLTFAWIYYWEYGIGEGPDFWIFTLLLLGGLYLTDRKKEKATIHWSRMISEESNQRAQRLSAMIQVVPEEKSRGINTDRTLKIFSGVKLFPFNQKGGTLLAFERRLRRGKGNLSLVVKIVGVHLFALAFIDIAIGRFVFHFLVFFILNEFLLSIWNGVLDEDWFYIYPFSQKSIKKGMTIGSFGYLTGYMIMVFVYQLLYWGDMRETGVTFLALLFFIWIINQWRGSTVFFNHMDQRKKRGWIDHGSY